MFTLGKHCTRLVFCRVHTLLQLEIYICTHIYKKCCRSKNRPWPWTRPWNRLKQGGSSSPVNQPHDITQGILPPSHLPLRPTPFPRGPAKGYPRTQGTPPRGDPLGDPQRIPEGIPQWISQWIPWRSPNGSNMPQHVHPPWGSPWSLTNPRAANMCRNRLLLVPILPRHPLKSSATRRECTLWERNPRPPRRIHL